LHKKENNYIWLPVPDPIQNGESVIKYDPDNDVVTMPMWYWRKLAAYITVTEANIEKMQK